MTHLFCLYQPVPVITQETTSALEEMIKKRILDNQFDDVERKADPTAKPFLPSKRVEISEEKSQKSLAEIYEEDYIKQKTNDQTNEKDEALKKEHEAITEMFTSLCQKLDALSNFHFTPKAVSIQTGWHGYYFETSGLTLFAWLAQTRSYNC